MNTNPNLRAIAGLVLAVSSATIQAQTIVYDNTAPNSTGATSRPNTDNPIYGDALTLTSGGTLTSVDLSVFNSSASGNTGFIFGGNMVVKFYDNTIPYTSGALNNPLLGTVNQALDFTSIGGLDPGFYTITTINATGLGIVLPQNILVTQQFTQTDGDSLRNGIVFQPNATVGSSPATYYQKATGVEGLASSGTSQIAYQVVVIPGAGGNHQPVANPQSISVLKNNGASITLTGSDSDNDPLTYTVATQPTNGTLSGSAPNLVYQPNLNFTGADSFTFTVNDGQTNSFPAVVSLSVGASAGLIITPVFDSTITSDPNAAAIINTINTAILSLESRYSDPINVLITFAEMGTGLGQSSTFVTTVSYSSFLSALTADAKTADDATALAHIPGGSSNPVDGTTSMRVTTANGRALGFNTSPPGGQSDSTISVNMSICNITRTSINPSKYDLQAVVTHELDEALGSISGLTRPNPNPVDLYRYSSSGARNYTTSGDDAYFSINATTDLVRFNQNAGGDYGDWWSTGAHTPRVQDAFGTPGATPDLGVELIMLDVIGYDRFIPASPPPVIQSVSAAAGTISFNWSSISGRVYQVQYKTNLSQVAWSNLGGQITASGPTTGSSDSITLGGPRRFYRVGLLPSSSFARTHVQKPEDITAPLTVVTHYLRPAPGRNEESDNSTSARVRIGRKLPVRDSGQAQ